MSVLRPRATVIHAVQPVLALGHAEVRWDALPRAVQDEVLARWCELLQAVTASDPPAAMTADDEDDASMGEP